MARELTAGEEERRIEDAEWRRDHGSELRPVRIAVSPDLGASIVVDLEGAQARVLEALAAARETSLEAIVSEAIRAYLAHTTAA